MLVYRRVNLINPAEIPNVDPQNFARGRLRPSMMARRCRAMPSPWSCAGIRLGLRSLHHLKSRNQMVESAATMVIFWCLCLSLISLILKWSWYDFDGDFTIDFMSKSIGVSANLLDFYGIDLLIQSDVNQWRAGKKVGVQTNHDGDMLLEYVVDIFHTHKI